MPDGLRSRYQRIAEAYLMLGGLFLTFLGAAVAFKAGWEFLT